ncbi:unnamed protein product [Protopolystoma xenopodis]|uniref:Uncharacterized protein n=1 Tax=Protopolystoma xenopodis TaxID=117903 RepID=A0A3S5BT62_9PLAT|nr:unnamed protein product [Protopolystoma xenopodis]
MGPSRHHGRDHRHRDRSHDWSRIHKSQRKNNDYVDNDGALTSAAAMSAGWTTSTSASHGFSRNRESERYGPFCPRNSNISPDHFYNQYSSQNPASKSHSRIKSSVPFWSSNRLLVQPSLPALTSPNSGSAYFSQALGSFCQEPPSYAEADSTLNVHKSSDPIASSRSVLVHLRQPTQLSRDPRLAPSK